MKNLHESKSYINLKESNTELEKITIEYENNKNKIYDNFVSNFYDFISDFFTLVPSVKKITWTQFTPYFNDGDACYFRICEPIFCNFDDNEFVSYYYPDEIPKNSWTGYSYNIEKINVELTKEEITAIQFIDSLISNNTDFMLKIFGDHRIINITSINGISHEEFEHD